MYKKRIKWKKRNVPPETAGGFMKEKRIYQEIPPPKKQIQTQKANTPVAILNSILIDIHRVLSNQSELGFNSSLSKVIVSIRQ